MLDQDKILNFLKSTGPTLPSKVAKNIGTDILFASAHLSFLVSQGKVKISHLKIGGSPLYFLPGQESQLYPFAAGNVNPKELRVLDWLKEEEVLREANLDLLSKVALRSLKDFAVPLHVTVAGKRELFWRWYVMEVDRTKEAIGEILRNDNLSKIKEDEKLKEPIKTVIPPVEVPTEGKESVNQNVPDKKVVSETKLIEPIKQNIDIKKETVEKSSEKINVEVKPPRIELENEVELKIKEDVVKEVKKKEIKEDLIEEKVEPKVKEDIKPKVVEEKKEIKKEEKSVPITKKEESKKTSEVLKEKVLETKIEKKVVRKKKSLLGDEFFPEVQNYLNSLEINIVRKEIVRKNSEINLRVKIKSVVGETEYFCKAKKKFRVDEKDVSAAYMEAQIQKLPLLFLYNNQITKKAEEILKNDAFSNAVVKKIG